MAYDILERLRAAIRQPGITKKRLAEQAGLHPNTLLGCEAEDWNPTMNTLRKLEPFLPPEQDAA